jgi:hypothetical protein
LKTNDSDSETFEKVIPGNSYYFLTYSVPIDMVLIPRRNIANLLFKIDLSDISNNIRCKHPKQKHISSNFELFHTSKVLIILNQMSSYLYGIYSQPKYRNFFNWNRFEVWNERFEMQTSKKERFSSSNVHKIHKSTVFLFRNQMRSYSYGPFFPAWIIQVFHLKSIWSPEHINPHAKSKLMGTAL